jgi:hypothetical protein
VDLPKPISDFTGQMNAFQSALGSSRNNKIGWNSTNSIFISVFGVNDVALQAYAGRNVATGQAILQPDVVDYFSILARQYNLGIRKFAIVLTPRKCLTSIQAQRHPLKLPSQQSPAPQSSPTAQPPTPPMWLR